MSFCSNEWENYITNINPFVFRNFCSIFWMKCSRETSKLYEILLYNIRYINILYTHNFNIYFHLFHCTCKKTPITLIDVNVKLEPASDQRDQQKNTKQILFRFHILFRIIDITNIWAFAGKFEFFNKIELIRADRTQSSTYVRQITCGYGHTTRDVPAELL